MSYITHLYAENVKRLKAVSISPKRGLNAIGGDNGEGKTSVLDSIAMGLGGKDYIPDVPIHTGKDSAKTIIRLDSGITITRTFTASGSYLKVVSPEGKPYSSPQAILDELTGKLTFDPLGFTRLDPKKQADTLRKLVNLDFTAHDQKRKQIYDERTVVNRRLEEMRASAATLPEYPDAPSEEVSSADILAKIEEAQEHNAAQAELDSAVTVAESNLTVYASNVTKTKTLIASLEKQLTAARVQLDKDTKAQTTSETALASAKVARDAFESIDTTDLKAQLATCEETNRQVRANVQLAKAIAEGRAKATESETLTAKLEAMDKQKADALAKAQFPVEGLSFADDIVTYKGLPFTQASSAEQQRVSVAIGAALNPKLRVMLIRDGSLLDERSLAALQQTAEELDLQLWIERVSKGAECSIIIEDGMVQGAEPIVVETTATESPPSKPAAKKRVSVATNVFTTAPVTAPTVTTAQLKRPLF